MIVIVFAILGIFLGLRAARKRSGNRLDMLQYATGYGIAFTLLGVFATLMIDKLAG